MAGETLNVMFRDQVKRSGARMAYKVKRGGRWVEVSWTEYGRKVDAFALGLVALGLPAGEAVSILGTTREEWDIADRALLALGSVPVGIYHSNLPDLVSYIISHSDSGTIIVEDKGQLDKVLEVRAECPDLERIIIIDADGAGDDPMLTTYDEVVRLGREEGEKHREEYDRRFAAVKPEDRAIIIYTSGTTGPPKGAILTHRNVYDCSRNNATLGTIRPEDITIAWLPLPHIYQRVALVTAIYLGTPWAYAESIDKLVENIKEVRPTVFYSVPRIYEKIHTKIMGEVEQAPPLKKKIFHWSVAVGSEVSRHLQHKETVPALLGLKHKLANRLVFKRIQDALGGRIRFIISGGAPISREILEFFHAAGILTIELYGITEALLCTTNREEDYKFGTVGLPSPGVELRIAEDGEILVRSSSVYDGYLKDPELTAEALEPDGWYHTGDIGELDGDGFLTITDRKKDIIITSGGKNLAPQNIENLMKQSPYISQMMVYGDKRKYLTALITLDEDEVPRYAETRGIASGDFAELTRHPEIRKLIEREVEAKNKDLARYETIKKFAILPRDFSQDDGEITPTLKVKRKAVTERYWDLLDGMYED